MLCISHTQHKDGVVEYIVHVSFSLVITNVFVAVTWQAKQCCVNISLQSVAAHLRLSAILLSMKLMAFLDVQKVASMNSRNFKYSISIHFFCGY